MTDDYIKKLEAMTPVLSETVDRRSGGIIEYTMEKGTCLGIGLYKNTTAAVQRSFLSKGSVFKSHAHKCAETLIIYEGLLRHFIDGESQDLGANDVVQIPANTPHSVEALEDTWLIAVTIPADDGYPSPVGKQTGRDFGAT